MIYFTNLINIFFFFAKTLEKSFQDLLRQFNSSFVLLILVLHFRLPVLSDSLICKSECCFSQHTNEFTCPDKVWKNHFFCLFIFLLKMIFSSKNQQNQLLANHDMTQSCVSCKNHWININYHWNLLGNLKTSITEECFWSSLIET